jgi:hypothetical protein
MFLIILKLWKESLNSDGQQFHQYQLNEQSPLTLIHWTQKWTMTYDAGTGKKMWRD